LRVVIKYSIAGSKAFDGSKEIMLFLKDVWMDENVALDFEFGRVVEG
jgi:hypothetical protein